MQITVSQTTPRRLANACHVLALSKGKLGPALSSIDQASGKAISRASKRGDARTDLGHTVVLHELADVPTPRILLAGIDQRNEVSPANFLTWCQSVVTALFATGADLAIVQLDNEIEVADRDTAWQCRQLAESLLGRAYVFSGHASKPLPDKSSLKRVVFRVDKPSQSAATTAVKQAHATAAGMHVTRDLGNLAPNICTPEYLANEARAMARGEDNFKTRVLDEKAMAKLGMGALLSVSRGSRQPARLICMEYSGGKSGTKPVVLVGKGVTFDTGGISIKPSQGMDEMKYDMCGAAAVFGVMRALVELKPRCNVIGVVAAAENMPDGEASRPGDVVTTMSGQTVEILNTDAEGRLVLCDALTYVERYKPKAVIDIATLTGACIIALGHVASGVMANDQSLADHLMKAGENAEDRCWQLPLWDDYQQQLDSNFADMANIGGRPAGSITAGCFLARFAEKYAWAHLDIAGVAWQSGGKEKGASGRPVPMLMRYLLDNHA